MEAAVSSEASVAFYTRLDGCVTSQKTAMLILPAVRGYQSGNALNLYSVGAEFKSRPGHLLPSIRFPF